MNLKRMLSNRRSVIITWLISYIVVLFVPVLFSAALYWEAQNTIDEQIQRANDTLLKQMQDAIDNEIAQVNRLTNEMYSNVKVHDLFYSNKFARDDFRYELYGITQDLGRYRSTFSNIDEYYIYWSTGDIVITPMVYKPSSLLYADLYSGSELSFGAWTNKISNLKQRQTMYTSRINETGRKQSYVSFISPFPADSNDKSVGSIVVMIDTNKLLHTISSVGQFNGGDLFILNENKQVLVSNTTKEIDLSPVSQILETSGNVYGNYHGIKSQFFYIKSYNSKLSYLMVVPGNLVWTASAYVRNVAAYSIVFSVLGGCILTVFFLRRNYKPLDSIMQSMRLYFGAEQKSGNEFHFIQNAFVDTVNEKEQTNVRLKQQQNQLRSHWISRLLKGRMDAQLSLEEAEPSFELEFDSENFCVLLFYLEDSELFFKKAHYLQVADKHKLLQFIVTNVVEELVNQRHTGYMAEVDDMMACLINVRQQDSKDTADQLEPIAREAQSFLLKHFEIEVTISISGFHTSKLEIPEAYNEALDAMEYKLIRGKHEIIRYEKIRKGDPSQLKAGYYYPLQIEQQLINYVKAGDVNKARASLNEIIERNFHQSVMTVELAKCLFFNLVSTFIKTMNEIGDMDIQETFFHNNPQAIEELTHSQTVADMHQQLLVMLEEVCRLTAAKLEANKLKLKDDGLGEFLQKIIKFVKENYADANLNISMIGDSFQMKPTYVSKLFKDHSGEGLLDYINKIRIEKAKTLLREGNIPLQEVANLSGFNDLNTFMRLFKKFEGITPGQYKTF
ncbi:AraC family transcriptional regulator [Paenibacillus periandrae]|uniref:AraC family transcriptional regulator n=1 Tax=Paenibacillus periandrae TaxID=1761741 RepID=UPI001F09C390|nr:AraC family transcriptional regulator [Paenibacillus periandrae]